MFIIRHPLTSSHWAEEWPNTCIGPFLQKRKTTTVSIEVRKSQHKYVIGPRGQTLQEILALTGNCLIFIPSNPFYY